MECKIVADNKIIVTISNVVFTTFLQYLDIIYQTRKTVFDHISNHQEES